MNAKEAISRVEREWRKWASNGRKSQGPADDEGASLTLECVNGVIYAFGSELAVLRLWRQHSSAPNARMGWSQNLQTWYFSLETPSANPA